MNLIADVRKITAETVEKIKAGQGDLDSIKRECQRNVQNRVDQYKKDIMAADDLDGSKLTDDVKLLNGDFQLSVADLNSMMERAAGNRTMEKLIYNYAKERGMDLRLAKHFYTAEQKCAAAEEFCMVYARNVCNRPEYFDIWGADEYFDEVTPEEIKGE